MTGATSERNLGVRGLDYQQRKRLTEILAQVWGDGFEYGQQVAQENQYPQHRELPGDRPPPNGFSLVIIGWRSGSTGDAA